MERSDFERFYDQVHDGGVFGLPNIYEMKSRYAVVLDSTPVVHPVAMEWTPQNLHPSGTTRWVEQGKTYITLAPDSRLTVEKGYRWDGPGNFGIDFSGLFPNMMRGSLVHDALYDLMRLGLLSRGEEVRDHADRTMAVMFIEDGVSPPLAGTAYLTVSTAGARAAKQTMPAWKTGEIHGYSYSGNPVSSMDTSSGSEYHR